MIMEKKLDVYTISFIVSFMLRLYNVHMLYNKKLILFKTPLGIVCVWDASDLWLYNELWQIMFYLVYGAMHQ